VNGPTPEPCGVCDSCKEIAAGSSLDVIEIDAASNRASIRFASCVKWCATLRAARSKVVILDEAHMLTGEASNALLKTLEEPPDRVIFVMPLPSRKILLIHSLALSAFPFSRAYFCEITGRLQEIAQKENLQIESERCGDCAHGRSSLRDALSLLEQARAFCGDKIRTKMHANCWVWCLTMLSKNWSGDCLRLGDRALGLVHTFQKEGGTYSTSAAKPSAHAQSLIARVVAQTRT